MPWSARKREKNSTFIVHFMGWKYFGECLIDKKFTLHIFISLTKLLKLKKSINIKNKQNIKLT